LACNTRYMSCVAAGRALLLCVVQSLGVGGLGCLYPASQRTTITWKDALTCCAGDQHTEGLCSSTFASWALVQQVTRQACQHCTRGTGYPYVYATRYPHGYAMHAQNQAVVCATI
jgi:hypothetical protein